MGFSFLAWNVEHFRGNVASRRRQVAELIDRHAPDVFAIIEFEAKEAARSLISQHYRDYDFGLTDSRRAIELLIGWRRGLFDQVIFTQRREFLSGNLDLRPGGLLSVLQNGETAFDNLLFLHTDSGRSARDFNNRQDMFRKIFRLKGALEGLPMQGGNARLIALGDLNTMGRRQSGNQPTVRAQTEIDDLEQDAIAAGMRMLTKSSDETFSNASGSTISNLDHVLASNDLGFVQFFFPSAPQTLFEVEVDGWNNLTGNARRSFIDNISDHCAIVGELV